jgi:hypothetical protein
MELVFVRIKESVYSDKAQPFAEQFAKNNNLKLTKYLDMNEIPAMFNEMKAYPVLFFVENGKILGHVKGFSTNELQIETYEAELKFAHNPNLRPKFD